jgi:putative ABC transport system substrate-binding protein
MGMRPLYANPWGGSRRRLVKAFMLVIVSVLGDSGTAIEATDYAVAIVYPDVREPFRTVFSNIVEGVEKGLETESVRYEISEGTTVEDLAAFIGKAAPGAIIALGHQSLELAERAESTVPIIAGGALLRPEDGARNVSGITFTADPGELFSRLLTVDSTVRRIVTVYDPEQSGWLIDAARDASAKLGITLIAKPASNLREAVEVYRAIFEDRDLKGAALWLPQDPSTVDTRTVLPLILSESWNQNRLVFSSLLGHVPRGVLFAMYPDNEAMGRSLAELAMRRISNNSSNGGIKPLKDLKFAINLRTADHLGLSFSKEQERQFDLTFPAR